MTRDEVIAELTRLRDRWVGRSDPDGLAEIAATTFLLQLVDLEVRVLYGAIRGWDQ